MRVAFYAPLKPPDSPVPSGDRTIGRMLMAALVAGGHDVRIVSRLRSFDRDGDGERQRRLAGIGARECERVLARLAGGGWRPDVWLTYHLYHKAPDHIGPTAARVLAIPYCVAEASSSPSRAAGRWAAGDRAVAAALAQAAVVLSVNPKDVAGVTPLIGARTRIVPIPPFIDGDPFVAARERRTSIRSALAERLRLDTGQPWLLAVGMMRSGDKARSYRVLACAASMLTDLPWQMLIVGGGAAREEIEGMFAFAADRVRFCGELATDQIAGLMAACDLLVWPGINEAIGMVYVEAAMAGLAVVGADRPGIAAVVEHGRTGLLVAEGDGAAFAGAVRALLGDDDRRWKMGADAAARARASHQVTNAGQLVCRALEEAMP